MKKTSEVLWTLRKMVDSFICRNDLQWDKYCEQYEKEHNGISIGVPLSLQSYIGSDLTIDMCVLAQWMEEYPSFTTEYWIRSQGTQHITTENDAKCVRDVFRDILGKIRITRDSDGEVTLEWIQDEDCLINNVLVKENKLYERW